MNKEANENKIYRYLDRYPSGVDGTYRDLEDVLGIDHTTIYRIMKDSDDIITTSKGDGNSKETHFKLKKYETKNYQVTKPKQKIMTKPIETKEIKFTTRQHRLCDYLLEHCMGKENRRDKVDILWDLQDVYFEFSDDLPFSKDEIKKTRHNWTEYAQLTKDIRFINQHGEIRQILIGSQGGHSGGIWTLRVGEQHDEIDKNFGEALKKLKHAWAMKKAAEKHANTKLVFKNEKNIMDILREFD